MLCGERYRTIGRVGSCLAIVLPILGAAGPQSSASAFDYRPAAFDYGPAQQRGDGHFSFELTPKDVPRGGDSGGSGHAWLDLDQAHGTGCFVLKWKGLEGVVTAADLDVGSRGTKGPHGIELFSGEHFVGTRNTISGCIQLDDGGNRSSGSARDKIQAIIKSPSSYYLDVHSTKFKDGAIRSQLG